MKKIDDLIHSLDISVDRVSIMTYIELNWVRPVYKDDDYYFEAIDSERIRLIHHLKQDMMIEDSAMDIILSLLDQLYGTRDQLSMVCKAITTQPKSIQDDIQTVLKKLSTL